MLRLKKFRSKLRAVKLFFLSALLLVLSSCASLSSSGVGRVKRYTVESESLPPSFDGYEIAFVSDIHYPSLFSQRRLGRLVNKLRALAPDMLLLGGDYVTDDAFVPELFDSIATVAPVDGIYAVWGNHEQRNKPVVSEYLARSGVQLLADDTAFIERDGSRFCLAGVSDSFHYDSLKGTPLDSVPDSCFTVLLCHTPDYAEQSSVAADIVLSGHTHGGQVSLFGLFTPVRNSKYGTRFLRGRNVTSSGATVITTNGVGTSRRKLRFCVPSEIVVVTLKRPGKR